MENAYLKKEMGLLVFDLKSVHQEPKGTEPAAGSNLSKKTSHVQNPRNR